VLEPLLGPGAAGADQRYREYAQILAARIHAHSNADQHQAAAARTENSGGAAQAPDARAEAPAGSAKPLDAGPTPAAVDRSPGLSSWGPWASIGVGGALLVAGAVTGLAALRADRRFVDGCPTLTECDPALEGFKNDAERYGRITNVLLISGATFVVGGVVWRIVVPTGAQHNGARREPLMVTMTARY
jgi:hypothetical protein